MGYLSSVMEYTRKRTGPRNDTIADWMMENPANTRPISPGPAARVTRASSEGPAGAPIEPKNMARNVFSIVARRLNLSKKLTARHAACITRKGR